MRCRFNCVAITAIVLAAVSFQPVFAQENDGDIPKAQPIARATAVEKEEDAKPDSSAGAPGSKVRPLSVTVDLITKTQITGTLTDTTNLEMKTSFGTASIPLSEVAGIRFADADQPTTAVVLLNGDVLTGATDVDLVTVETEWGTASINGQSVASILLVPGLAWETEQGINGKRWNLVNTEKQPQRQTAASGTPAVPPRSPLNLNTELVQPQQMIRN